MKSSFFLRIFLILGMALLCTGSIRKNEDPVTGSTQTGPISLRQKMEEEKDGPKGAPSPSMTFYPNQQFLTTPPVGDQPENSQETFETAVEDEDHWWSGEDEEAFE